MQLLYQAAASRWEESLPLGNGTLGAMIWGGIGQEKIGLNDDRLWSGYPSKKGDPNAWQSFEAIKQDLKNKDRSAAQDKIQSSFLSDFTESYLPLGNLLLDLQLDGEVSDYRRRLDLERAVAKVSYQQAGTFIERDYFTSYPDQALRGRIKASQPLTVTFSFESQIKYQLSAAGPASLTLRVKAPERVEPPYIHGPEPIYYGDRGLDFSYQLDITATDGKVHIDQGQLQISSASQIDWRFGKICQNEGTMTEAAEVSKRPANVLSYDEAKAAHLADYQALFQRVELNLGPQLSLPTDQRLERLKEGQADPGLIALYFQYGRYLLIASSRPGSLPANLQGIWAWELRSPWSANWTTNINSSMNYWGADSCNLSECFQPYSDFVTQLTQAGKETAHDFYRARGSVCHHNTDRWFHTVPVGKAFGADKAQSGAEVYALWPMALLWMVADLYRHYEYTADETYLKETVFPILSEVVAFIIDYLTLDEGLYHTIPSTSPENSFFDEDGQVRSVDRSSAMDIQLIQEVFGRYQTVCQQLAIAGEHLSQIERIQARLAPLKIGSKGQVLEWQEEYTEVEPGHRHFSHLYGAYPSEVFDQAFLSASRRSLEIRKAHGSGHTGWSNAWLVSLYAVLGDGEAAYQHILHGIAQASYPNLWSSHPPFQIDGNFGMMAGIANLFVQDRQGQLTLLPALPKALQSGSVKGLRIKGNRQVDIQWQEAKIIHQKIY